MTILNVDINEVGEAGVNPRIVRIETNNTRAEVIATGFLNDLVKKSRIELLPTDIAVVSTKTSAGATESATDWYDVVKSGDNWNLVATNANVNLADGKILVGDSDGVAQAVDMSGDATIDNAGALTLADDSVENAQIADNAVSLENLDSAITPSHIVVFAGEHTTAGGSATESITVNGAVGTDLAICQLKTEGASPVTLDAAASNTDAIDLTFSADPSTDHVVTYSLLRATS